MDKGIDYSLGQSNFDKETGIHYGVISQHSIMSEAMEDFKMDYGSPVCPKCGNEVKPRNGKTEFRCKECKYNFDSDEAYGDETIGFTYNQDGYILTNCLDTDIFVLKSPYFTYVQYCSPCVPGAGNLDTPIENGVKTYALGHDWFENGKVPYPLYDVKTEKEVLTE